MRSSTWPSSQLPLKYPATSNLTVPWRHLAACYPPTPYRLMRTTPAWRTVHFVSKMPPTDSQFVMRGPR